MYLWFDFIRKSNQGWTCSKKYPNEGLDNIPLDKLRIIFSVRSEYLSFVLRMVGGQKELYAKILFMALYEMVGSTLFWYQLFSSVLQVIGFELNLYNPCVAKMVINGSKGIDDNMIMHKENGMIQE